MWSSGPGVTRCTGTGRGDQDNREAEEVKGGGVAPWLKSREPHLAGGEKHIPSPIPTPPGVSEMVTARLGKGGPSCSAVARK